MHKIIKYAHLRGKDGPLTVMKDQKVLTVEFKGEQLSIAPFPYVYISTNNQSDYWDLVREEILDVQIPLMITGVKKRKQVMICQLRKKLMTQLLQ